MRRSKRRTPSFPARCKIPADIWPDVMGSAPGGQKEPPPWPCQNGKALLPATASPEKITEKCLLRHKREGQRRARVTVASPDALMSAGDIPSRNPRWNPPAPNCGLREVQRTQTTRKSRTEGGKGQNSAICRQIWRRHCYPKEHLLN